MQWPAPNDQTKAVAFQTPGVRPAVCCGELLPSRRRLPGAEFDYGVVRALWSARISDPAAGAL